MAKLSRSELRRLLVASTDSPSTGPSTPGAQIGQLTVPPTRQDRDLVGEILGQAILLEDEKVAAVVRTAREVRSESLRFFDSSVTIGRSVNRLRSVLGRSEFTRVVSNSPRLFGLSRTIVVQLMAVADGVDQDMIPPALAPRSYSVYYQIVTLPPADRELALKQRILRPDVTRSEIIAFKRRNDTKLPDYTTGPRDMSDRQRRSRRAELLRQRDRLMHELRACEAELKQLDQAQAGSAR